MEENPTPIHTADRDAVIELLNSQGDIRLLTMIGFGYIERYLGELIRAHLRDLAPAAKDYLLDKRLRHLSERINFALALGSIEEGVAKHLRTFAEIRNRFAHHIQARDCSDGKVAAEIDRLHLVTEALAEAGPGPYSADVRLRIMISITVLKLHDLVEAPFKGPRAAPQSG